MQISTTDSVRKALIHAARAEYITPGKTKNISEAVRWYIAEHLIRSAGIPATITPREKDRPRTILDEYERPTCPKCGAALFWKSGCSSCKGPVKKNQWICVACGFIHFTKDTLAEAIAKLEKKEA